MPLHSIPPLNSGTSRPRSYTIAAVLRDSIYRGDLAAGEQLYQSALAEQLGVSPIPLREALKQLESEGLVAFRGHRGAVVTGLSAADAVEIYDMILWLETGLFKVAFPSFNIPFLQSLHGLLDRMESENDCILWKELNCEFHNSLYEAADRPLAVDHLAMLRQQVDRYIRTHLETMRDESQKGHRAILTAAIKGDLEGGLAALTDHLTLTSSQLQRLMKNE